MSTTDLSSEIYYDPYDVAIDLDPYPVWKRLRDEAPLYYNAKHDFYAISRFDDVDAAITDWETYSSARGTLLELIKANIKMPAGTFIFEDPPEHTMHRDILRRVFTPRRVAELEPKVREFCAHSLDPLVGTGGFDFIEHLGAQMPMRTIGMLLGIPEEDQENLRDQIDDTLKLKDDGTPNFTDGIDTADISALFGEYIDWRAKHPSDDLMTQLIQAEFEDETGTVRTLRRDEILGYINLIAAAGNETTTRLIGWMGKALADHPEQRELLVADRSLVPRAVEEVLRFEAPSPVQARYVTKDVEHYGTKVPEGSVILLLNAAANRDDRHYEDPDRFDIMRKSDRHLSFGLGIHFCLGASLARLEGQVALDEVLKRFPTWEIDTANAKRAHTSTVRGWEKLPVITP